jgi:hypothetical protein
MLEAAKPVTARCWLKANWTALEKEAVPDQLQLDEDEEA